MKSVGFLKACSILPVCFCLYARAQSTNPDRPVLEKVSVDPQTGYVTIEWNVPKPPEPVSPVSTDEFIIYWYEKSSSATTNHPIASILNSSARSYTFNYDTMKVRTPKMPDPRRTTVAFSIAAVHNNPYSLSMRSYEDYNVQLAGKYDSCRAEIRLDWRPYRGWESNAPPYKPLLGYRVMRIMQGGPEQEIKILSAQDTFYIAPRVNENESYVYYIEAFTDRMTATSYRATVETKMPVAPSFIAADVTRYNDMGMAEISFRLDPAAQTRDYELLGSGNPGYSFVSLGNFRIFGDTTLTDVQTREKTHYYKLQAWHVCKNRYTAESNMATALRLALKQDDQSNLLQWQPYLDWNGEAQYELHRQTGSGPDETVALITDPAATVFRDDLSGVKIEGDMCYRIIARPVTPGPFPRYAVSNTACIQPESEIFIPQAFTPNGDGQNDSYKPFFSYPPQEYMLCVYDRAGATVFRTEDVNAGVDEVQTKPLKAYMRNGLLHASGLAAGKP